MPWWKKLSRFAQGLTLIMVGVLFFIWGIFGTATVQNQNEHILQGVHQAVDESFSLIVENQKIILAQGDYVTCLLKMKPEDRHPKDVHRCLRTSGLNKLT